MPQGDRQSSVEIGVVARAHGVRGELRVHLHNPASRALESAPTIEIGDAVYEVESIRDTNKAVLVMLVGVADRNDAEKLKGQAISVDRQFLELDDDEVLLTDLVGLRAVLEDGTDWGVVVGVEPGAQDRLQVRCRGKVLELPIVDALVGEVDLAEKTVLVWPPEGLDEL